MMNLNTVLTLLLFVVLFYLAGAFTALSFNFLVWPEWLRAAAIGAAIVAWITD